LISRIPISDISPTVYFGGEFLPVKAIAGEVIQVSATAVIEGHEKLSAEVVLHDSKGKVVSRGQMREIWPGTNRYEGAITVPSEGDFFFVVEADSTSQYRTVYGSTEKYPIRADRSKSLVGSWYEFFPRSEGAIKKSDGTIVSGTFATAAKRLAAVAEMGFDVLYLPPIHPIGLSHRKGPNNSLTATTADPGVPWAIGSADGGHDSINPDLGSMKDFENFVTQAKKNGLEIALDLALQTSPDHPWVKSNPQWFNKRSDGTIAYAENPPKKYQDIYPINFDDDYEGIRDEVLRIIRLWVSKGVKIFRVDNPHTKPVHFWQDLLDIVHTESPEVIFLAEAFTSPAMMHALGKAGFHQSYTYFTWRTSKYELTEYGREVSNQTSAFFRPNFWVNTPDINPFHLHTGNPAMFALRAVLASTLSPSWGMYAGYEIYEHRPFKEGGEEYLDSEKYEIKLRDWDGASKKGLTLAPFITQLNTIRKANPALQRLRNLVFHNTESDAVIAYSKRDGNNFILVVVNLDPTFMQGTIVHWDLNALGLNSSEFEVKDLLDGKKFTWSEHQFIQLDPTRPIGKVAHICQVKLK
jgi:starch synthase (maltosyl-transferring)